MVHLLVFISCGKKEEKIKGFSETKEHLYFRLIQFGESEKQARYNDVLWMDIAFKTQSDSVFWDSRHQAPEGYFHAYLEEKKNGNFSDYFSRIREGDSLHFWVNTKTFYSSNFGTGIPYFSTQDSLVGVMVHLRKILSPTEYKNVQQSQQDRLLQLRLKEEEAIRQFCRDSLPGALALPEGVFFTRLREGTGELGKAGQKMLIQYTGCFLDGKIMDQNPEGKPFEVKLGESDQLLPGLEVVLPYLKLKEKAKIIVPSHLAFGEKGSNNGIVPPFTPLVYEIEIIAINP